MPRKRTKAGTSKKAAAHRRDLFVEHYIANGRNATEAAKASGYSPRTAYAAGARLLKYVEIAKAIEQRGSEALDQAKLTADEVLTSQARAVNFDPRKLCRPDGSFKLPHELDDDTALALNAVKMKPIVVGSGEKAKVIAYEIEYKACDRNAARDQAAKNHGLYDKDNRQKGDPIRELLAAIDGNPKSRLASMVVENAEPWDSHRPKAPK
jgi:phage terminase small subunit